MLETFELFGDSVALISRGEVGWRVEGASVEEAYRRVALLLDALYALPGATGVFQEHGVERMGL